MLGFFSATKLHCLYKSSDENSMIKIQDMIELFTECKQTHLFGMILMSSMCEYFETLSRFCCVFFLQNQKLGLICVAWKDSLTASAISLKPWKTKQREFQIVNIRNI